MRNPGGGKLGFAHHYFDPNHSLSDFSSLLDLAPYLFLSTVVLNTNPVPNTDLPQHSEQIPKGMCAAANNTSVTFTDRSLSWVFLLSLCCYPNALQCLTKLTPYMNLWTGNMRSGTSLNLRMCRFISA